MIDAKLEHMRRQRTTTHTKEVMPSVVAQEIAALKAEMAKLVALRAELDRLRSDFERHSHEAIDLTKRSA